MDVTNEQPDDDVDVEQDAIEAERKRIESTREAIRGIQKATETVVKYCTNENFRQVTMQVLKVQEWDRVPDEVHARLAHLTNKYHKVDITKQEAVAAAAAVSIAAVADVQTNKENDDEDFDRLAAYAELTESEP